MRKIYLLLILSILSSCVIAQDKYWNRVLLSKGKPTINPTSGVNTQYACIDTAGNGNVLYVWKNSAWVRTGTTFAGSGGSARGIASAAINGSGQLVLTYTDATTQNVGTVKGADGAAGATGPAGPPGVSGSGTSTAVWSPDNYRAVKTNRTLAAAGYNQTAIDTLFPGIGATTTDQVDWAAWQYCISIAPDGAIVVASGNYYLNKGIRFADDKKVHVYGGILNAVNNNVWTFLYRTAPGTNEVLANQQNLNRFTFNNMVLNGTNSSGTVFQKGHEMQGSYNSEYNNIQYNNLTDCGIMNFELNTKISYCLANGCVRGWSVGYLPGLLISFYQSNNCHFYACQFRGNPAPTPSEYAFKFRAVSGCVVDKCIVEGKQVVNAVDFDDENVSTVFEFRVTAMHFECEQGATNAAVKIRNRQGIMMMDGMFGQSPALLADCFSYTGNSRLIVKNVPYWVPNASGKMFRNQDFSYVFENNYGQMYLASNIPNLFTGTPVIQITGTSTGNNAFKHIGLP